MVKIKQSHATSNPLQCLVNCNAIGKTSRQMTQYERHKMRVVKLEAERLIRNEKAKRIKDLKTWKSKETKKNGKILKEYTEA
ncbi:MAG: hypothetical protein ACREFE_10255, partial [Limisphaerales bacterium]